MGKLNKSASSRDKPEIIAEFVYDDRSEKLPANPDPYATLTRSQRTSQIPSC